MLRAHRPVLAAALATLVAAALSACSAAAATSPSSSSSSPSSASPATGSGATASRGAGTSQVTSASPGSAPTSPPTSPPPSPPPSAHGADGQVWTPTSFGDQQVLQTTLTGAASHVTMKVWVWTPPQYSDPSYAHTDFPVLFLYPGGDGSTNNNWTDESYAAQDVVTRGVENGTVLPFVFVMPEMQVSKAVDTECTDMPGEPAVGTFLDTDVPTVVQHDFRVLPPGRGWGTAGASAGAYCAAAIALRHPDEYGAVVSIDGYFTMDTPLRQSALPAVEALYPTALAPRSTGSAAWLFVVGAKSSLDISAARSFAPLLHPPATTQTYVQPGGVHLTTSFKAAMPRVFAFFSQHLAPPRSG